MKRFLSVYITATLLCFIAMPAMKASASSSVKPVLITEMSPGTSASASQEFVELYNQSTQAIDLEAGKWQLQIASSKATSWEKAKVVSLAGTFYPGTYMLISSNYIASGQTKSYLQDYATAQFSAGLTSSSGHIRLAQTLDGTVNTVDVLEWSTLDGSGVPTSPAIETRPFVALDKTLDEDASIKRRISSGVFADAALGNDFLVSLCPSPTNTNRQSEASSSAIAPVTTTIDSSNQACAPIEDPEDPGGGVVGAPEEPPAILLPAEESPTGASSSKLPSIPLADRGLSSPAITELLPNPGSPQTDAADEFIELYNGNNATFDLSGFQLRAGLTENKKYTFPEGTTIAPQTFKAFYSADTKLSLSNTSGKVALYDPLGTLLVQTKEYASAKDNLSWALAQGNWQWTTKPTPNATNAIIAPAAKKSAAKTASKKSDAKPAGARSGASAASTADMQSVSNVDDHRPIHPVVFAVVGGFALLYGAYEYRHDLANKFFQLRSYRAARRKTRQELKGR